LATNVSTRESRLRGSLRFLVQGAVIIVALLVVFLPPSAQWVEEHFSNGYYPVWQNAIATITLPAIFSYGDIVGIAFLIVLVVILARGHRLRVRAGFGVAFVHTLLNLATLAAFITIWFYASWGWGYERAPLEARTAFVAGRINPQSTEQLRSDAIAHMNALALRAHAVKDGTFDRTLLRNSWLDVVQRLGDTWTPRVGRTKISIAAPLMNANGTSGFVNPFTVESQLATDLLWFEVPFTSAHEWSHAAGFNREDEANYIAAISCVRDSDVVAQYSGWLELFLYLPPKQHYERSTFVPQLWSDFDALRERNAHFLNARFARISWRAYNSYLKSNHIASGVENYNEVTRLLLGIPLDDKGLPVAKR